MQTTNSKAPKELETTADGCLIPPQITAEDVIYFREKMKLTQQQFASQFDIPISTLRNWEQNRSKPVISHTRLALYSKIFDEKSRVIESTGDENRSNERVA